jgi:anti-sigma factor RsiW
MTFPMDTGKDCVHAWEMMPWVLQGSATQEQDAWLESHLAQCESCRAEFAQQSRLRLALSLPADVPVNADVGLGRLLARLDTADAPEERPRSRPVSWLGRALVAAVLVQALGIGVLGVKLWAVGSGNPPYRTLSQETLPAAPGAIRVVPDASMTLADWSALLRALRLQVVSGPNDVGAYTVAPVSSASTAQHALQQLRSTRGIRLAEPVAVTP